MAKERATPISSLVGKAKKSRRRTSNSKKQKRFQYRSNLQGVISKILSLGLTDGHIERLRAYCPFWKLINLILDHKITLESVKKSDIELANLIDLFNKKTRTFDIGGKSCKLSSQDVISAFGVTGGVQTVFTSQDKCTETSFYENFEGIKRLRTPIVSKALRAAVKCKGLDAANNVVQLMTLYLLTALFAPTKGATFCWGYNKILSQVEKINSYDWPRHIYDKLHKSIIRYPSRKVTGCVMLIPYWIMENFQVATPRKENADLWCEKWDLQDLMVIGTNGVISQVLNTQYSIMDNFQVAIATPRKEKADLWCEKWALQDLMVIETNGVISQVLNTQGETVCQLCGDGSPYALIFCGKCMDYAIHRYCLDVLPAIDEYVRWFCVDCEEKHGKPYPSKEPSSVSSLITSDKAPCRTLRTQPKIMKHLKSTNDSFQHKRILDVRREKGNSSLVKATAEKSYENTLQPHRIQRKPAESDKIVHDYPSKANKSRSKKETLFARPVDVITNPKVPCEGNNESMVSEGEKLCIAGADVARTEPDSQIVLVDSSNVPEANERILAQPLIDPIWRGSFNIETDGYGVCDGLAGHLSSKACPKVWEEAELLSKSLCMELVPKASVWPKSFQISEPSDESIALYFFALKESCIKALDDLVSEMMCKELALTAVVTNAQLLVFTSNELPLSYWKFEGKFYLWGVFKEKQAALIDSANYQLGIQSVGDGEDSSTKNMSLDSLSPISPLSNISNSGLRWTRPDAGELKLNVDVVFKGMENTKRGAMGGLIRNHDGEWVHGFYMYAKDLQPEKAHFFAICNGLEIASKFGIRKLTLESDSKNVVEAICSARKDHQMQYYIDFIKGLMQKNWLCRIKWINTEANSCANRLTQEALITMTTNELAEPPEFMLPFLNADRNSS